MHQKRCYLSSKEVNVVKVSHEKTSATMPPKEKRNAPAASKVSATEHAEARRVMLPEQPPAAKRRRKGPSASDKFHSKPAGSNSAGEHFDGLPLDLVRVIFAFLNGDSWGRWSAMAGVCRAFHGWHLTMLPNQLQIEICHRAHMNDRRLALLSQSSGRRMGSLDLGDCRNLTDAGLASLSSLTGLQTLNLRECGKITDAGLSSLSSLTGLQTLNLNYCYKITDAGVSSLSSLTGLQTLDLAYCDKITDAGVASLSSLTGLQTLILYDCDRITDAAVSFFSSTVKILR